MFQCKALAKMEKEKDALKEVPEKNEKDYLKLVRDKMMGIAFLKRSNDKRYGRLITSIRDQHSFKRDVYPTSLHEAYELLENHSLSTKGAGSGETRAQVGAERRDRRTQPGRGDGGGQYRRRRGGHVTGMQYTQVTLVPGSDGRTVERIEC